MIYIQDHIDKEESLSLNDDSNQSESSFNSEDDIILFPSEPQYEVSKEETGKWVDQLMEFGELTQTNPMNGLATTTTSIAIAMTIAKATVTTTQPCL